jgi:Ca2+-binding RTX toxin-like protein
VCIGLLVAVAIGVAPTAALAGEARVDGDVLRYVAAGGEANALRVDRAPRRLLFACALLCTGEDVRPPAFLVRDDGAPVTAGDGCVAAGPNAAVCTLPRDQIDVEIVADLGDRRDTASANGAFRFVVDGGDGGDELHGMDGVDGAALLMGGAGADLLDGGAGDDRIELREQPAMPDEATCGRGEDVVVIGQWDVVADDRGCETVESDQPPA